MASTKIKYRASFTIRKPDGIDVAAKVDIAADDWGIRPVANIIQMSMADEPCILTWSSVDQFSGLQSSQLELRAVAQTDGAYREIVEHDSYCTLTINGSVWWRGKIAKRTISENFSRNAGYVVSITFSDFGYLERRFVPAELKDTQQSIRNLFTTAIGNIQAATPALSAEAMTDAQLDGVDFLDLKVGTDLMFDSEGEGRSWKDVLDEVLQPAGVHCLQFNGAYRFYTLQDVEKSSNRASVEARGTDAMLTQCGQYKKITLTYDQESDESLAKYTIPEDMVSYDKGWAHVMPFSGDTSDDATYIFLGNKVYAGPQGYYCVISQGENTFIRGIMLNPSGNWADPYGWRYTTNTPGTATNNFAHLPELKIKVNGMTTPANLPPNAQYLKLSADVYIIKKVESATAKKSAIAFEVYFETYAGETYRWCECWPKEDDPSFNGGKGWWNTQEYQPSQYDLTDDYSFTPSEISQHYNRLTLSITTSVPGSGVIRFNAYCPDTAAYYSDENFIFLLGESATMGGYINKGAIDHNNKRVEFDADHTDGDELSIEYKYGCPVILSSFVNTDYRSGVSAKAYAFNQTYLQKAIDRIKALNTKRYIVKGTYAYDHTKKPFFDTSATPLHTISSGLPNAWMLNEQWNLRKGYSDLTLEFLPNIATASFNNYILTGNTRIENGKVKGVGNTDRIMQTTVSIAAVDGSKRATYIGLINEPLYKVGTAADYANAATNIVTRVIQHVNLGDLVWSGSPQSAYSHAFRARLAGGKGNVNLLAVGYTTLSAATMWITNSDAASVGGKAISSIYYNNECWLGISDDSYTDAATLKEALNGVILYFEAATPTSESALMPIISRWVSGMSLESANSVQGTITLP